MTWQEVKDFLDHMRTTCIDERQRLKLRCRALEGALVDLLDTVERGDEFKIWERKQVAGRLLGLARYE